MDTLCYLGPERVLVAKRHQRCYCVHATIVKPFEQRPWGGIVLDDGFRFVCRHATKACQLLLPELPKSRERLAVNLLQARTKDEAQRTTVQRTSARRLVPRLDNEAHFHAIMAK
eukprot:TRINITY_DN11759_c0_g1_i3.p1 TRINITY_DN11759_c0_g1~~TRINITY_DN11759_c0_g1_i3.p1  ORF type:complete len:114 (-),score=8.54 TRINITY_DN11759_c0_g1_i3:99-440(-)